MIMAITALDVAFATAVAAVAGAIAAPVATYLAVLAGNRHRRWEKSYDDRRDALLRVLRMLETTHRDISDFANALETNDASRYGRIPGTTMGEEIERSVTFRAYATGPMAQAMDAYMTAIKATREALKAVDTHTPQGRAEGAAEIRARLKDAYKEGSTLQRQIREDLRH